MQLRPNVDGRSGDDIHVPLFDRCPTLESKRGNLGIAAGSPPHVVAGLHRGGRHASRHTPTTSCTRFKRYGDCRRILETLLCGIGKRSLR